ncbi:carbon-nitrogen hydrolase family protein [Novipirellula sp. SH528]|uniref:carbon-nitrogen hydrolase family protein n=1 Tax=Novipirellula sp. SH528 TaxID=3454466 RepID=UPI003FA0AF3B
MTPFSIGGLQLHTSGLRDNLPYMTAKLDYFMYLYPWVQMVVFSELASHGPNPAKAEPLPGPSERKFQEMAANHKIWIVNGSLVEILNGKKYNTLSVIDPTGKVVGRYRKMFPFLPYEEGTSCGDSFFVFDVPDAGRFGVSICYDMWFPETSRTLVSMGAEVILHPTLTGTIDRDVELSIVRATSAMNQCFMFDINGVGDGGNGRSIICGPAGDVLHQFGAAEELVPMEIDLDRVRRYREVGMRGLGQPLKSFRDSEVVFPVYAPGGRRGDYLQSLGTLEKMSRGSRAGLDEGAGLDQA